ncbi:MAG: cell division ATP-binding protein FtsE [Thermodesulfobacteriota bacterium]|nr:cell division ATP-binding protein FtsE [Thermodesulfobacteriota bacterium]
MELTESTLLLDVVKVSKTYPPDVIALDDISFNIQKGEIVFLTGRSGAGKTTLLKLICCLEKPTRGYIEIGGNDLAKMKPVSIQELRQHIGVAYQNFRLLPKLTVFQNIAMPLEVCYMDRKTIRTRVHELLDALDIIKKVNVRTDKLSRGEQQRVAIARAAANKPSLLLADEPTGNLDTASTRRVMDLFQHLNSEGATIMIATHDELIYKKTRHRVFSLDQGQLQLVQTEAVVQKEQKA